MASPPHDDVRNHVWVSAETRRFHLKLALSLDALLLVEEVGVRRVSYKEISRLVLIHDGHLPPSADAATLRRLELIAQLLPSRREIMPEPPRIVES